ncbi:MAG: hypothetical protein HC878_09740 [Leptolyngbyaceae cyanobacterium SL_5_14]|nr:hypothetical protein [Leptolyngbyaceae cyanobacterium SL_5_14]
MCESVLCGDRSFHTFCFGMEGAIAFGSSYEQGLGAVGRLPLLRFLMQ